MVEITLVFVLLVVAGLLVVAVLVWDMTLVSALLVALLMVAVLVLVLEWYWWEDGGGGSDVGADWPVATMSALAECSLVSATGLLAVMLSILGGVVEWPRGRQENGTMPTTERCRCSQRTAEHTSYTHTPVTTIGEVEQGLSRCQILSQILSTTAPHALDTHAHPHEARPHPRAPPLTTTHLSRA